MSDPQSGIGRSPTSIYVSGPVLTKRGQGRLSRFYPQIEQYLSERNIQSNLPYRDSYANNLVPKEFFGYTRERIGQAHGIITVIAPGDQSTPVEAAIADSLGIPQYLIFTSNRRPPRLMQGLPSVVGSERLAIGGNGSQLGRIVERLTYGYGRR